MWSIVLGGACPYMLSRQLINFLLDQGSNLSNEHAYIIPSLKEILKPAQLIKHQVLYTLLNCTVPSEYLDIHPKQYMYTQKIHWSQYSRELGHHSRYLHYKELQF